MQQAHRGIKGIVTNQITGKPIPNATISLTDRENYINTTLNGEYWKILLPGVYKLRVSVYITKTNHFLHDTLILFQSTTKY